VAADVTNRFAMQSKYGTQCLTLRLTHYNFRASFNLSYVLFRLLCAPSSFVARKKKHQFFFFLCAPFLPLPLCGASTNRFGVQTKYGTQCLTLPLEILFNKNFWDD
jgi:hypothetical protein